MNSIATFSRRLLFSPAIQGNAFKLAAARSYSAHKTESFEEFCAKWTDFFKNVDDVSELQRGLEASFQEDLVPTVECCDAALRAARRLNDYTLAVRVLAAVKHKVPSASLYATYLEHLNPTITELGIDTPEALA